MSTFQFELHDISDFPIVRISVNGLPAGYTRTWVPEMDALVQRGDPFVLVLVDGHGEDSPQDRKSKAQWIKVNKGAFAASCRGFVSVEPSLAKRLALRAQGAIIARTFGLNFVAARDLAEAETAARRLLAGEVDVDGGE
ncbi:hypothetical protein [Reyranella sp. CPCC 100927]|uniref:hypothetical protein n=1 Tax=Reyranella sp. CPCC 100927 TaxID=2599616 RepID=UPI0011B3B8E3|nr:hypothetical protein [Reyranella sp. CPCC 100927]TWT14868.1 hypothetical protein FQU96_00430 [Reyranella sp. CPCC 100927]